MLLPQEPHAVDHLLCTRARRFESLVEAGVLSLEMLYTLRRDNTLYTCLLEGFESRLRLQCATTERRQLIAEVLHQLLQLRKRGYFRTCAV